MVVQTWVASIAVRIGGPILHLVILVNELRSSPYIFRKFKQFSYKIKRISYFLA